jgi:hypothetical protein
MKYGFNLLERPAKAIVFVLIMVAAVDYFVATDARGSAILLSIAGLYVMMCFVLNKETGFTKS